MIQGIEPAWVYRLPALAYVAVMFTPPTETTGDYNPYDFSCLVKGLKPWDPDTSTYVWTKNPALITADALANKRYGMASPDVNWTAVSAAKAACDAVVATPPIAPTAGSGRRPA